MRNKIANLLTGNETRKPMVPMNIQFFAEPDPQADPQEDPEPDPQEDPQEDPDPDRQAKPKTFTQEEVNAMMAREKKQGRQSVYNKLNRLGINEKVLDTLVETVASDNAQTIPPEVNEQLVAKDQELLVTRVRAELSLEGVNKTAVDDMQVLVAAKLDPQSYTMDDIADAIKDIKQRHAHHFNAITKDEKPATGTGAHVTAGTTPAGSGAKDTESIGARLAKQRYNR